ncbi:hypothetical protein [Burkholderia sp. F1]|uniref:hypothetical protein n=1 Tax=Burkholderia sp. F1 TaxID=3366817 RepID=UPI003D7586BB
MRIGEVFSRSKYIDRIDSIRHQYGELSITHILEKIMTRIVWGSIDANGGVLNGSGDFTVERVDNGKYTVAFNPGFSKLPGVVASQNNFDQTNQSNMDGVAIPFVNVNFCQLNTGDDQHHLQNRSFAFIAIGD